MDRAHSPGMSGTRPEVHSMPTPENRALVAAMRDLHMPFPVFWDPLPDRGHVETVAGAVMRSMPSPLFRRQPIPAHDGGTICLDWHLPEQDLPYNAPLLVLVAGLTGGSDSSYVRHATLAAARRGFRVVAYNHCGTANTAVTSPRLYSASYTEDLRDALRHVSATHPGAPITVAAWSIGANILVHLLAEEAEGGGACSTTSRAAPPITAAAVLCNPFDLVKADVHWRGPNAGFRRFYDHFLALRMRAVFQAHAAVLTQPASRGRSDALEVLRRPGMVQAPHARTPVRPTDAARATTVRAFDDAATIHWFGFESVDAYYHAASSSRVIHKVKTRLLCVQAMDDPIAPAFAIPYQAFATNHHLVLVTTPTGGHLGWVGGPGGLRGEPWTDRLVLDYLDAALGIAARDPPAPCHTASEHQPAMVVANDTPCTAAKEP